MTENTGLIAANVGVLKDGLPLKDDLQLGIQKAVVVQELNLWTQFRIIFNISRPGKLLALDFGDLNLGDKITVSLCKEKIVTGFVTAMEPNFNGEPVLELRGYDALYNFKFEKKRRTFENKKDSAIFKQIAGEFKLKTRVVDTMNKRPSVAQYNQTDYEFLRGLVERLNLEFFVEDDTLVLQQPQDDAAPSTTLEFNRELINFEPRARVIDGGTEVTIKSRTRKDKDVFSYTTRPTDKSFTPTGTEQSGADRTGSAVTGASSRTYILNEDVGSAREAEAVAKARLNRQLQEFVTGRAYSVGDVSIRPGRTVKLKGISNFDGAYYVTFAEHTYDTNGYYTRFKVRRANI